jgi:hypothetical protein
MRDKSEKQVTLRGRHRQKGEGKRSDEDEYG